MGRALLEDAEIAGLCDRCAAAAQVDLRHLLTEAGEEELRLTQNAQPALTFTSLALVEVLRREGVTPDAAAGHSVGEYSALAAAGALSVEDAVRLVSERGRAMADAAPAGTTTMAAVLGLTTEQVTRALEGLEGVWAANLNTPTQTVIAGTTGQVEAASARLRDAGARRVLPLNVSAAFHTPLVAAAAERLSAVIATVTWSQPRFPVVANLTAQPYRSAAEIPGVLARQLISPVRWAESVGALERLGTAAYVEVGPGRALTGMLKELAPAARALRAGSIEEAQGLPGSLLE